MNMHRVENVVTAPLQETRFIEPIEIHYTQDGVEKRWEAVRAHDSVAILLYHREFDAFLLVKQFRPPVYLNADTDGITYELCAGILDKDADIAQIAKEEIDEECGYDVALEDLRKVTSFYTSVGFAGSHQTLYYAEIDESMKMHDGGGIHQEQIELYFLPLNEAHAFILDESKPKTPGLMYAFMWFFAQRD